MSNLRDELKELIEGDVLSDAETLDEYSRDTSLFKVTPEVVAFPKSSKDVKKIVSFVSENKSERPTLSITGRSGGTDMTGGPLNESIIMGFTKYMNAHNVDEEAMSATVSPGLFYRNFEKEILPEHLSFPTYPASKNIAALGGMIMNNSGGEKTLRYGQTRDYVNEVSMVLSDGNEYSFGPLEKRDLEKKLVQKDFEGGVYKKTFDLLEENYDLVKSAEPHVSKNSAGYALWRVWDKKTFDLSQLFVGSQGTLGVLTGAKLKLIKESPEKKMIALFFKSWDELPAVVNTLLPYNPESLEAFDRATLKLGLRFMPEIAKKTGTSFLKFAWKFLPEVLIGLKMFGMPKLIVLVELAEDDVETINQKVADIEEDLKKFKVWYRTIPTIAEEEKYWIMRRESFNLLRQHVKGKQTAPFVEDFCVQPDKLPEFLPKVLKILKKNGIKATLAGHAGNGNFHIIPLMDLTKEKERAKIVPVADEIYSLIVKYGGTITAEHNDGILRTPYLEEMYGEKVYGLFKEIKNIFDPQNIFNPGKKVGGSKKYLEEHISAKK